MTSSYQLLNIKITVKFCYPFKWFGEVLNHNYQLTLLCHWINWRTLNEFIHNYANTKGFVRVKCILHNHVVSWKSPIYQNWKHRVNTRVRSSKIAALLLLNMFEEATFCFKKYFLASMIFAWNGGKYYKYEKFVNLNEVLSFCSEIS